MVFDIHWFLAVVYLLYIGLGMVWVHVGESRISSLRGRLYWYGGFVIFSGLYWLFLVEFGVQDVFNVLKVVR